MFGLGPTELIVILVLALLVLGPQRIPEAAASLGKAIRGFRNATRELRDQLEVEDHIRQPLEDLRSALRDEPPPSRFYDSVRPSGTEGGLLTPALPAPVASTLATAPVAAPPSVVASAEPVAVAAAPAPVEASAVASAPEALLTPVAPVAETPAKG